MKVKLILIWLALTVGLSAQIQIHKYPDRESAREASTAWAEKYRLMMVYVSPVSPSMLGKVRPNSYVTVCPSMEYKVGQTVLFKSSRKNINVIHDVIAVREGAVYTKGTFNSVGDGWIPLRNVIGIVDSVFIW